MASSVNFGTQQYFGFDPRTIPGCSMWLDAADSNSLTLSGSNVTAWADKSGNANNAAAGASTPPVLSNYNGRTAIAWTATTQRLTTVSNSPTPGSAARSIFVVTHNPLSTSKFYMVTGTETGATPAIAWGYAKNANADYTYPFLYSTAGIDIFSNVQIRDTPTILTTVFDGGTSITGWINSAYQIAKTGSINTTATPWYLGLRTTGDGSLDSLLLEVVHYAGALTTAQRQQVEGYLAWKWGLRTNLPTGHPFKSVPPIMRAFQPLDVTLPSLWLDAADARTLTLSGSNVTAWTDKTRGTAITIGGSGGLTSTSNDVTTSPARTSYFTVPVDIRRSVTPNLSAFIVYAWLGQSSGTDQVFWGNDNPNNQNRAQFFTFPIFPTINFAYLLAGGLYLINTSVLNTSATQLYTAIEQVGVTNGTAVYVNGALGPAGTGTASSNTSFAGNEILYFGGGETASIYPSYTQFREIVFYSSALTTSERQQVEGYLAHKWGLRGSLPATHPFRTLFPTTPLFVPTQISGATLWLDAADATTLTLSGSNVTTWSDKSGNTSLSQSTVTFQPTYVSNGFNGRPTLQFTGVQGVSYQYLQSATTSLYNSISSFTLFAVMRVVSTPPSYPSPISLQNKVSFYLRGLNNASGFTGSNIWTYQGSAFVASPDTIFPYDTNTFSCLSLGATQQFFLNGSNTIASPSFTFGTGTNVSTIVGWSGYNANDGFNGYISEMIVYTSPLTTSQRQQIEGYLAWKWGLQTSLPSTHPYAKVRP